MNVSFPLWSYQMKNVHCCTKAFPKAFYLIAVSTHWHRGISSLIYCNCKVDRTYINKWVIALYCSALTDIEILSLYQARTKPRMIFLSFVIWHIKWNIIFVVVNIIIIIRFKHACVILFYTVSIAIIHIQFVCTHKYI